MDGLMSIGEFSAMSGLSPKRLRTYAMGGLLVPAAVASDSAYRYYSPRQLPEAQLIDALRRAGMPLAEIKTLLRDPTPARLDRWAGQLRADAERKQQAIARARELLAAMDTAPTSIGEDEAMMRVHLQTAGRSETGPVRENNEDTVVVGDQLLAVADGMGGNPGGELASALATQTIAATFTGKSLDELEAAVRAANWAVWDRTCNNPHLQGMGTTVCALGVLDNDVIAIAHVGDSRAYLARDGSLRALTDDHTIAGEMLRRGQLTAHEAGQHPHRRLLTRALGVAPHVDIDSWCLQLEPGDRLLICSDGVFSTLPDEQTEELLNAARSPQAAADAIVDVALERGSDDNVTAVVAFVAA